jgi:hypothetical protein
MKPVDRQRRSSTSDVKTRPSNEIFRNFEFITKKPLPEIPEGMKNIVAVHSTEKHTIY